MNTFMKKFAITFTAAASTLAVSTANATIVYTDFSSTAGLQLNGSAAQVGTVLRLTPANTFQAGSAFSTTPISLASDASFSSLFKFRITDSGGIGDSDGRGADGIVFVIQTVGNNVVGGAGGGLGYQGISNSVGIEFDSWNNGLWDDYNGNHVGINLNGNVNSVVQSNLPTGSLHANRLNNGQIWSAWVDYNGATDALEVRLAQGATAARPSSPLLTYTVDLVNVLSSTNAYVGFTSGTGAAYGNHDILAWQFTSDNHIPAVPLPATSWLFLSALLGVLGMRRKPI